MRRYTRYMPSRPYRDAVAIVQEIRVSDRSCKSRQTLTHHGSSTFEGYKARVGCAEAGSRSWISISASCEHPSRQTRSGLPRSAQNNPRPRMFLASASEMSLRHIAKDANGILGREIPDKHRARSAHSARLEKVGLDRYEGMAMRIEKSAKTGGASR